MEKSSNDGNTFVEQELDLSSQLPRNDTVTNDATTCMVAFTRSQNATTVKSPIGQFVCIFYIIHCYNNLTSSTQSQTHSQSLTRSQSQNATTLKSLIGQFFCYHLYNSLL